MTTIFGDLLYNNDATGFMDKLHVAGEFDIEQWKKVRVAVFAFMGNIIKQQPMHPKDIADFAMLCYDIPQFENIEGMDDVETVVLDWIEQLGNM